MTTEINEPSLAGSCFICDSASGDHTHDAESSSNISRRNVLRGAALAPVALAGAAALAAPKPAQAALTAR